MVHLWDITDLDLIPMSARMQLLAGHDQHSMRRHLPVVPAMFPGLLVPTCGTALVHSNPYTAPDLIHKGWRLSRLALHRSAVRVVSQGAKLGHRPVREHRPRDDILDW